MATDMCGNAEFNWNTKRDILFPMNVPLSASENTIDNIIAMVVEHMATIRVLENTVPNSGLENTVTYWSNPTKVPSLVCILDTIESTEGIIKKMMKRANAGAKGSNLYAFLSIHCPLHFYVHIADCRSASCALYLAMLHTTQFSAMVVGATN